MSNKMGLFVGGLAAVSVISLFVSFSGKGQTNQQRKPTTDQIPSGQAAKQIDDEATPIVDFDNPSTADRIDKNARKLKGVRYEKGMIPRFGQPADVARAILFFLEPDSYLTGQVLAVDGGLTTKM